MRFIDEATITIRAGKGGNGCVSFRRERFIPKGGPDGGDGGKGGDVILRVEPRMLTLFDLRLKRVYEAENGRGGMGNQKNGRGGEDLVVDVPPGTQVYWLPPEPAAPQDVEEDETPEEGTEEAAPEEDAFTEPRLLADLSSDGQTVVAAQGGRGGKGNLHFKSSTNRAPRYAQPGEPGQEKRLKLVLKILADVGLLGLPNAGKSTLLSAVSAAQPKIAAYPFTTLSPNLGVIQYDDDRRLVMADIPGLVEGAHEGVGLGHRFLKHVERTRCLVHLLAFEELDLEALEAGEDPFMAFDLLNGELAQYSPELAQKPQLLVVNKLDLAGADVLDKVRAAAEKQSRGPVRFISAQRGDGLPELLQAVWDLSLEAQA